MYTFKPHRLIAIGLTLLIAITTNGQSPGGVSTNLKLWLNANTGVSLSGSNVTAWADQSGGSNNASTVNGISPVRTTSALNSYPVITFNAGGLAGVFGTAVTASNVSAFVVTKVNTASSMPSGIFSITSTGSTDSAAANSAVLFQRKGNAVATNRSSTLQGNYNNANAINNFHLFTTEFTATQNLFFKEGGAATNSTYTAAAFNAVNFNIGARRNTAASTYLNGQIAEVILYDRLVSATEKNKIESYLALKYGFTLSQTSATNYVNAAGTVIWNATTNASYNNNVFGVGKDVTSGLSQSASVSLNTSILSLSGSTPATNNFLIIGDNGGSSAAITATAGLPSGCTYKVSVNYRASETGETGSESFTFTNPVNYYNPIGLFTTPIMLVDSNGDGTFDFTVTNSGSAGSNFTFTANLGDGDIFSFGYTGTLPNIDFGDAYNAPTTVAQNGAAHKIVAGVYLGSGVDAEPDAYPSVNEVGDDSTGTADEDGVDFNLGVTTNGANILQIGQSNSIKVTASVAGYLSAWIDYNQNGVYTDRAEQVYNNYAIAAGTNTVSFNISDSVYYGPTTMRFRFAQNNGDVTSSTGLATNGEVEDYKVFITAPLAGACANTFQNPGFELGPAPGTYIITGDTNLPYWRTTATDHDIEIWKTGFNGVPAYAGTYFAELNANLPSALYQDIYTTPGSTVMWHFAHRGRAGTDVCELKMGPPGSTTQQFVATDGTSGWGSYTGSYIVPANQYITRFEFNAVSTSGGNLSIGNFLDDVYVSANFDYGDAPDSYGTLALSGGPIHNINTNLRLGASVTCDGAGMPGPAANGDTGDDGVTFPASPTSGTTYSVTVSVYNNTGANAYLAGWMDFNRNGVFDASERVSATVGTSASAQNVVLTFTPLQSFFTTSTTGGVYARFRISSTASEVTLPTGVASSGEVEDYLHTCSGLPLPIPTNNGPVCTGNVLNLTATSTAPYFQWTGPMGFSSSAQNPSISSVPAADSGSYRVYAFYADGCETDSATLVSINDCFVSISGFLFDDANGNGTIDGTDAKTNLSQTLYAVMTDTAGAVLATGSIGSAGAFTVSGIPANRTGMRLAVSTTQPAVSSTPTLPVWPAQWAGTLGNYGANNLAGTGVNNSETVAVYTGFSNITNVLLGFDRLPISTAYTVTIPYPHHNSKQKLTAAAGLRTLIGTDPEDGTVSNFSVNDLSGMNGNTLYYDANGDTVLASYEAISGYTVWTNFDPNKLYVKYTGWSSTSTTFIYSAIDAAGKTNTTPSSYRIGWSGSLPVKLIDFSAEINDGTRTILRWSTASEIDNDHFVIERSIDAENWTDIGTVKGSGSTNEQHDYSYTDEQPLPGINYYRLRQVDVDGHYDLSEIATVTYDEALSPMHIAIYPNPLPKHAVLNINCSDAGTTLSSITITNIMGAIVYNEGHVDAVSHQISGIDIPAGIYLVTMRITGDKIISTKVVIE